MEKIKNIWENRRFRGILFIIFYIILFSYIFIIYGNRSEKVILPETVPKKHEKKVYDSYEYEYIHDGITTNVTKYNDIISFTLDDINYYYINNRTYKLDLEELYEVENPLKYNFDYLNNIEEMKKISSIVKTTTYADGLIEENYNINLSQLLSMFNIETVDTKEITNYSIYTYENKITKIEFNDLNVKLNYTNFDNVSEIKINYDFYEGEV